MSIAITKKSPPSPHLDLSLMHNVLFVCCFIGTIPMPPADLFTPSFAPTVLPSTYPFHDHIKYPMEYSGLSTNNKTPVLPNSPLSHTSAHSPSESESESPTEEVRSAFVPIRLNTLPPTSAAITPPSSSSPGRSPALSKKPTEGVRCELKAPTALISKRSQSPTKLSTAPPTRPVWRPY